MNRRVCVAAALIGVAVVGAGCAANRDARGFRHAVDLPDLSGLAWVGGDRFVAVHDAKAKDEADRPRVSLLELPESLDGVRWKSAQVSWRGSISDDLESAAAIPGTDRVLLVESGDSGKGTTRLFVAQVRGDRVDVVNEAPWPHSICNVESTAVGRVGDGFVFLFAERNQPDASCRPANEDSTVIYWASFDPDSLQFGSFSSAPVQSPDPENTNRPIVGLDVGRDGSVYAVAAFDPETAGMPDPDNGPFRSSVWVIGRIEAAQDGVRFVGAPARLVGAVDGFKVESVSLRPDPHHAGREQVFIGTDDENYGGVLRMLPRRGE